MNWGSLQRALSSVVFAGFVVSIVHCGGGGQKETFTADGDANVTNGVVGTWQGVSSSGLAYTLTLCEDDAASRQTLLSCQTLHRVRGGGRGVNETTEEPTGCGGCDYDYSLYVTGTLSGDDLAPTPIQGQFGLSGGDSAGLPFPYTVRIFAQSTSGYSERAISLSGEAPKADELTFDPAQIVPTARAADAGETSVDAGGDAGGDADASAALAPSESDGGSQAGGNSPITFHRVGDATCPQP